MDTGWALNRRRMWDPTLDLQPFDATMQRFDLCGSALKVLPMEGLQVCTSETMHSLKLGHGLASINSRFIREEGVSGNIFRPTGNGHPRAL